ncbi:MAG: glycosyltransferase family 2 protein [Candidatus Omnitrophica bacterium]|nr:glycosyltransferase family 2 protein [Candidatus Omnitrophota bacterium]
MLNSAIKSVLDQTIANWELIVVDDASSDGTYDGMQDWISKDERIYYFKNNFSLGGSGARNIGISKARGEYIAFLDDDDIWLPKKLEKQMDILEEDGDAVASTCWFSANYLWGRCIVRPTNNPNLQEVLSRNILGSASLCMVRKSVLDELGGFSDNLPSAQDWDFWVKLLKQGRVVSVPEVLVKYFVHQNVRISTNLTNKYIGFRRIYFKYKYSMLEKSRKEVLSIIAYINSRRSLKLQNKLRWLRKSLSWSSDPRRKIGYIISFLFHLLKV